MFGLTYLRAMAHANLWSNHRLLEACAELTPEAFAATRASFFPSLQATLNHILIVDWYYVDALEGGPLGLAAFVDVVPCPALPDLAREQQAVDERLVDFCERLDEADLGAEVRMDRRTHIQTSRTDRLLLHLFTHQTHHRGQAHAMLAGTHVRPPQLDEFFLAGEADRRADDFAQLGLEEDAIWGALVGTLSS